MPGFGVTKYTWEKDIVNYKIIKVDFLKKLKKIGDVYTYTPNIYNIASYYKLFKNNKNKKIERKFSDKPHEISLGDIDIDKQCKLIYEKVKKYKGKFIPIGHSVGGLFALHFSNLYPSRCSKIILIESASIVSKRLYKQLMVKKKYNISNKELKNIVEKIKTKKDNDKLINKLYDITDYYYYKIFNKKIKKNIIPLLLFNPILVSDNKKEDNKYNKLHLEGVKELYKIYKNKLSVVNLVNTGHFPWLIQKYNDEMIRQIKCFID